MTTPRQPDLELEERLGEAMASYFREVDAGRPPDAEQWLVRHPDLAPLLQAVLDGEQVFRRLAAPLIESQQAFAEAPESMQAPAIDQAGAFPRLVLAVTEGPHTGRVFHFSGHDTLLVGRSKRAHFRLPARDEYFSRIHFLVEVNPPDCRLMDMGSTNGTQVNGERVTVVNLKDGDVIRAGQTVLRVTLEQDWDSELATRLVPADAGGGRSPLKCPPAENATADALPPQGADGSPPVFEGFQILRELGQGGMGRVYLALRKTDNTVVALKAVEPAVRGNKVQMERFLREAEILRQLDHPHIVAFREMGQSQGVLFFAMDYVPGVDAGRLVERDGPLDIARAVRLACELLEALQYAHARQFVHRDVKPANLMVTTQDGREAVKVVDFGLARVYQASRLSGLTITGQVGGTAAFMAPEQISDFRDARPPVDQYAAAATLYYLLTGKHVYDYPASSQKRLLMILQDDPVPLRSRRADLPEALAAVIHRALAREPGERFPDAAALRQALLPFGEDIE